MPVYDYKWEEDPTYPAPYCRTKTCKKAHYKHNEPKRRMVTLRVTPDRSSGLTTIWFCNHCKAIRFIGR